MPSASQSRKAQQSNRRDRRTKTVTGRRRDAQIGGETQSGFNNLLLQWDATNEQSTGFPIFHLEMELRSSSTPSSTGLVFQLPMLMPSVSLSSVNIVALQKRIDL